MAFVSNHDKNAWEGTEFEQFGDALQAAIVLSAVGEGIPLIYNGQEAGSDKRLLFFDKTPSTGRAISSETSTPGCSHSRRVTRPCGTARGEPR